MEDLFLPVGNDLPAHGSERNPQHQLGTPFLLGIFVLLSFILFVFDVEAATTTVQVSARIIPSLSATTISGLSFGDLSVGPLGGEVIVPANGSGRSATGGVELRNADTSSPANIRVVGAKNASYSVSLPRSVSIMNGEGQSMEVEGFDVDDSGGQLSASGEQNVKVGGTLRVPGNQPLGDYTGLLVVRVDYN